MTIALTKTLDPADFDQLPKELALVDVFFHADAVQHAMRRWEYAIALDAVCRWEQDRQAHVAYDIGGAGSPWHRILGHELGTTIRIIDPSWPAERGGRDSCTLETFVHSNPALADVVTCLSVLEHVDDVDRFLYHLNCLVAPGGLLVLTVDCCGDDDHLEKQDQHHFHWMRKRIFTLSHWEYLHYSLRPYGFELFGDHDWSFHGNQVYDYTFASLAMRKRI
jgi:Methyltransferase domain